MANFVVSLFFFAVLSLEQEAKHTNTSCPLKPGPKYACAFQLQPLISDFFVLFFLLSFFLLVCYLFFSVGWVCGVRCQYYFFGHGIYLF